MKLPSFLRTLTGQLIAACVVGVGLIFAFTGFVNPGRGQVLDSKTQLPIAGAEVRFDCQTSSGLENWRTLRWVSAGTDEKGVYRFWPWSVFGCQSGSLSARKEGYVSLSGIEHVSRSNEGHVFMMAPEGEANLRRLEIMNSGSVVPGESAQPKYASKRAEYHDVYFRFVDSKTIARTPREKAFVVESYCARLAGLHEALSPAERIALAKEREFVKIRVPVGWHTIDHEGEVTAYCSKGGL